MREQRTVVERSRMKNELENGLTFWGGVFCCFGLVAVSVAAEENCEQTLPAAETSIESVAPEGADSGVTVEPSDAQSDKQPDEPASEQNNTDTSTPDQEEEPSAFETLWETFAGGKFTLDIRARAEIVDQTNLDTAQAYTARTRFGYGTKALYGFSFYFDFEDIRSANDDLYNAAGLNGQPRKAVVADPEDTELNQLFGRYSSEYVTATAGRQRLILDDHRFVGNVGWRQNEQTFDAYTLASGWILKTPLLYSYVDDVNRIFGPDARRDFESDSHVVNLSFDLLPLGKLTTFGYFLDFPNSPANSSHTYGARLGAKHTRGREYITYAASYAYQVDAGPNPTDYAAGYYFVEGAYGTEDIGDVGVGYEVLGSDDGRFAFRTPLATGHKFNGWADSFLVTPANGLEDVYFFVNAYLPAGIEGRLVHHLFFSHRRNREFGGEFDALLSKAFNEHVSVLGKLAIFEGEAGFPDVQKYWMQVQVTF